MFIIYVIDLSIKMKSIDEGSYLYKNKKGRPLEVEKKIFSAILFQRLVIFPICVFFRKCSMFRRSIPLKEESKEKTKRVLHLIASSEINFGVRIYTSPETILLFR